MSDFLQITDLSQWQGTTVDFAVMKAKGVDGVIIRATHGLTIDTQLRRNAVLARQNFGRNVGFYVFSNPKRSGPVPAADALVHAIQEAHGSLDTFVMVDIEPYANESPNKGQTIPAHDYAVWLDLHISSLRGAFGDDRVIGYTNDAYWRSGVNDPGLAAELDWIGARYPVYSHSGYDKFPLPGPDGWEAWAFARAKGPVMPKGSRPWCGWQFSAGYNRQGPVYGCGSSDLDLNIVKRDAWERWTRQNVPTPPQPPIEHPPVVVQPLPVEGDSMFAGFMTNNEPRTADGATFPAGKFQYALIFDGEKVTKLRQMVSVSDDSATDPRFSKQSNATIDGIPDYAGMKGVTAVLPPIKFPTYGPVGS